MNPPAAQTQPRATVIASGSGHRLHSIRIFLAAILVAAGLSRVSAQVWYSQARGPVSTGQFWTDEQKALTVPLNQHVVLDSVSPEVTRPGWFLIQAFAVLDPNIEVPDGGFTGQGYYMYLQLAGGQRTAPTLAVSRIGAYCQSVNSTPVTYPSGSVSLNWVFRVTQPGKYHFSTEALNQSYSDGYVFDHNLTVTFVAEPVVDLSAAGVHGPQNIGVAPGQVLSPSK
jgi:hypothetical protein